MPNIRPITLDCDDLAPSVIVRQQPHPFNVDEPECWITTVTFGTYPNEVSLVFQTPDRDGGLDLVGQVANRIINQASLVVA